MSEIVLGVWIFAGLHVVITSISKEHLHDAPLCLF